MPDPTWTYSGNPASSTLDEVRFLIQDTDTNDQLVQNGEINYMLAKKGSPLRAAAALCRQVALKYGREMDTNGETGFKAREKYEQYRLMADELEKEASRSCAPRLFAGGLSQSDKSTSRSETDLVQPGFRVDLHTQRDTSASDD